MESVFSWLREMALMGVEMYPWLGIVLSALGTAVIIGQMVVVITPTPKDDEVLNELMKKSYIKQAVELLKSFAPFQKGSEGLEKSSESTK